MKTNHLILSILCAFCTLSCSHDDDIIIEKNYVLSSVRWNLEEGDGVEFIEKEFKDPAIYNKSNIPITIDFYPYKNKETSLFQSNEEDRLNELIGEEVYLSVPTYSSFLSPEYKYLTGGSQALFHIGETNGIISNRQSSSSITLNPHTKIELSLIVYFEQITATYTVNFRNENDSNDYIEIKGKWTGLIVKKLDSTYNTSPIE